MQPVSVRGSFFFRRKRQGYAFLQTLGEKYFGLFRIILEGGSCQGQSKIGSSFIEERVSQSLTSLISHPSVTGNKGKKNMEGAQQRQHEKIAEQE